MTRGPRGVVPEQLRDKLERAARQCPVHATLGDRVEAPITFLWGE